MGERIEPTLGDFSADVTSTRSPHQVQKKTIQRKPWLAFLLGFLVGPVSWTYVGHYWIGVLIYFLQLGLVALLGLTGWVQSVAGVYSIALIGVTASVIGIVVPWIIARRIKNTFEPRWYNRWYWYPLLWLIVVLPFGYAALNKATFFGFGTYRIPSGSMEPTIAIGDFILADTRSGRVEKVSRGDIVVHYAKRDAGVLYIRRVVGLPGEHVIIDDNAVQIDGKEIPQAGTGPNILNDRWMRYRDMKLGSDEYFLMGDNRGNSFDSRTEGPYSRNSIVGIATTRWYSAQRKPLGPLGN